MRLRLLLASAVLPLVLWAILPVVSQGSSPNSRLHDIQKKIQITQGKIGRRKGTERLLTTQISAYTTQDRPPPVAHRRAPGAPVQRSG